MLRTRSVLRCAYSITPLRVGVARLAQLHRLEAQRQALEGDGGTMHGQCAAGRGSRADFEESRPHQEIAAGFSLTENGTAHLLLRARCALESALDGRV